MADDLDIQFRTEITTADTAVTVAIEIRMCDGAMHARHIRLFCWSIGYVTVRESLVLDSWKLAHLEPAGRYWPQRTKMATRQ